MHGRHGSSFSCTAKGMSFFPCLAKKLSFSSMESLKHTCLITFHPHLRDHIFKVVCFLTRIEIKLQRCTRIEPWTHMLCEQWLMNARLRTSGPLFTTRLCVAWSMYYSDFHRVWQWPCYKQPGTLVQSSQFVELKMPQPWPPISMGKCSLWAKMSWRCYLTFDVRWWQGRCRSWLTLRGWQVEHRPIWKMGVFSRTLMTLSLPRDTNTTSASLILPSSLLIPVRRSVSKTGQTACSLELICRFFYCSCCVFVVVWSWQWQWWSLCEASQLFWVIVVVVMVVVILHSCFMAISVISTDVISRRGKALAELVECLDTAYGNPFGTKLSLMVHHHKVYCVV